MADLPGGTGRHDHHTLDEVSDFTDVAGPVVGLYFLQNTVGKALLDIIFLAEVVEKMKAQGNDILLPVPNRRNG